VNRTLAPLARFVIAGAMFLTLAAPATAADTARVRVLHASPDAPAVDVYLDDTAVSALTNVPFGTISPYLDIPAGDHNVKVYATGTTSDPVIDADVSVTAGAMYTIAATNAVASIEAQVLPDAPSATCDSAQVRVVHFSADAPAVDVATAGAEPADAVVKNLAYPSASDYVALPAGTYDLEVRVAGETTTALALPDVAVEACNSYSAFAIGSAASPAVGDNPLRVVLAVDATASASGEGSGGAAPTPPATDTVGSAGAAGEAPVAAPILAIGLAAAVAMIVTLRQVGRQKGRGI
jgi:hypothetical protein